MLLGFSDAGAGSAAVAIIAIIVGIVNVTTQSCPPHENVNVNEPEQLESSETIGRSKQSSPKNLCIIVHLQPLPGS